MESPWAPLANAFRNAADHWATTSAIGTFVLYLFGYLSLRFKLTVLGIGTDLNFLDERYLFEGIRFLVYIVSIIPNLLFVGLVLAAPVWLAVRLMPSAWRERTTKALGDREAWRWASHPLLLPMMGIMISLIVIQVFLRKVLLLSDLLVTDRLTEEGWLNCMLVGGSIVPTYLYFHMLVVGAILTVALLLMARTSEVDGSRGRLARGVLAFLVALQVLLLPINYGVLVSAAQAMPRVRAGSGALPPAAGATAWLVWEGRNGITFFVDERIGRGNRRALVTLPKDELSKLEIVGYDSPVRHLFGRECTSRDPSQSSPTEAAR